MSNDFTDKSNLRKAGDKRYVVNLEGHEMEFPKTALEIYQDFVEMGYFFNEETYEEWYLEMLADGDYLRLYAYPREGIELTQTYPGWNRDWHRINREMYFLDVGEVEDSLSGNKSFARKSSGNSLRLGVYDVCGDTEDYDTPGFDKSALSKFVANLPPAWTLYGELTEDAIVEADDFYGDYSSPNIIVEYNDCLLGKIEVMYSITGGIHDYNPRNDPVSDLYNVEVNASYKGQPEVYFLTWEKMHFSGVISNIQGFIEDVVDEAYKDNGL